jgi:hypothetical protein
MVGAIIFMTVWAMSICGAQMTVGGGGGGPQGPNYKEKLKLSFVQSKKEIAILWNDSVWIIKNRNMSLLF